MPEYQDLGAQLGGEFNLIGSEEAGADFRLPNLGAYKYQVERAFKKNDEVDFSGANTAARSARRDFLRLAEGYELQVAGDVNHHDWEVAHQVCMLTSTGGGAELAEKKAFLVVAAHQFDDFLDAKTEIGNRDLFLKHRQEFGRFLSKLGSWGVVFQEVIKNADHPELVEKGFQRIAMGAVIMYSEGPQRASLLAEYVKLSTADLDAETADFVRSLDPEVYQLTSRSVQELFLGAEENAGPEQIKLAELCSIALAPAALLHNHQIESARGEKPSDVTPEQLGKLIRDVTPLLVAANSNPKLVLQFECVMTLYQERFPEEVAEAYQQLIANLRA